MYKVIATANAGNFASGEMETGEEWEFETLEEAQEFVANFDRDTLWEMALETLQPECYLRILTEDDEEIE